MTGLDRVVVAGAGAFGTALAIAAHRAGREVILWTRDPGQAAAIRADGENGRHLPGVTLPGSITVTADLPGLSGGELVLLAVPAQASRSTLAALDSHIRARVPVVACAKGIEQGTGLLQTDIIAALMPEALPAGMSGPGFAEDIAAGLPTALTIAAGDIVLAERLATCLSSESFRLYASDDLIGVELGGALKNVLAIACGVASGLGLGEGARAALIARGLAEAMRLGLALGARPETFMGLSGLGDLVLTATSAQSRNTRFGAALAEGRSVAELMAAGAPLAEGAHTARSAAALAGRHGVDAPIILAVAAIIEERTTVREAIAGLFSRPLRRESG